jgi:glycosyltransferase involved in cell wall biosynthesis
MPRTIAFYAPLKPPGHPIPSGDREIARNLVKALRLAGYRVIIPTEAISYQKRPSAALFAERKALCEAEASRLMDDWSRQPGEAPDLWFTYHPYCKSPDWIGPPVARALNIPYVTAEACRTRQATDADWAEARAAVQAAVRQAAVNFCLKPSDRAYLASFLPDMKTVAPLAPFIDEADLTRTPPLPRGDTVPVILAVGMMRPGAKIESYRLLAEALAGLEHLDWRLVVVGDGPERAVVEAMFAFAGSRNTFTGALAREEVTARMASADLFAWPGVREAFGMVYLEAQAAGLPVVAFDTAGVPIVVTDGTGGLLAPEGDLEAYRGHLARLLASPGERRRLGDAARREVADRHGLTAAAATLDAALRPLFVTERSA